MSLDVYLTVDVPVPTEPVVHIREDGQQKSITLQEWYQRHPDRVPVVMNEELSNTIYSGNITHNLNKMASEAGIYQHLWRPEELGITIAGELIEPLWSGLQRLKDSPGTYEVFNPSNGWGDYDGLVQFVSEYLAACEAHPTAKVSVSR